VIGCFAAGFGLIEMFLLGDGFWRSLGVDQYWIAVKGLSPRMLVNGVPGNFYGQYGLTPDLGTRARRMVSSYGDPLAAGYGLLLVATLCRPATIRSRRGHRWGG